jgi:hypothetical protein
VDRVSQANRDPPTPGRRGSDDASPRPHSNLTRPRPRHYGRQMQRSRVAANLASSSLFALAGLHVAWGAGSCWPLPDREALADAVIGGDVVPSPVACYLVGGALTTAGLLVAGRPRRHRSLRRLGVVGVVAVLAGRGVLGLTGRTSLVSPTSTSARFARLDLRVYSPLCLTLASLASLSLRCP